MSDAPKTLSLDSSEWKALLLANLARAHGFVNEAASITPEGLAAFGSHMDRMKGIAAAWQASQPSTQPDPKPEPAPAQTAATGNGAAVKKKGGWPLGKSRKRNNPNNTAVQ